MNPFALYKISYGLFVVSSRMGDKFNGQIANTITQVTAEPAQVAVALNKQNLTHDYVVESNLFSASILSQETPMKFIGQFGFNSGRELDKFQNVNYKIGKTGSPIVYDNSVAFLETEVVNSIDVGTHTIFVGKVVDMGIINDFEPMTYAYYHLIKGGKSPKNAPTYLKPETEVEGVNLEKNRCQICGYIYDPRKGDPEAEVAAMTEFAKLPENWVCPICGAAKEQFELGK